MIPVFVGYDPREAAVFHVLVESLMDTASVPLSIIPLHTPMLDDFDGQQDGTNAFIYSRFLVPDLMNHKGWAIFIDSDMMFRDDIKKLWDLRDDSKAVMVVQHDYETKARTKFLGTPIESKNETYPRKNWSSVVLWNCGHPLNRIITRKFCSEAGGRVLHRFSWLDDNQIGEIPKEWNHLVGEYSINPNAKNVHYTLGSPGFKRYSDSEHSDLWHDYLLRSIEMIGRDPQEMVRRCKHGF